ncbi:Manganese transport system ATP-binding protein MntB [Waddlia chondrophila 2032/99]|uniref:ABC-type transporter, ATPase subunit n=2 Tax=Waddlia chondrophila TaxID=71667 RepID=D6YSH1_WADCW|nr:ABC transporter ATP-binding protein [Waddlia chondrophila]ADI39016.1 ABC-type transporter, ATPase subunit [Waddlia chondrophila WSU 86-1044]CCB92135.1 Manganese transport system ATP-binding protein MntB [Waddlia chondrophila 2032/99]
MKDKSGALTTHQLSVNYGDVSALWDVSLQVPAGVVAGIIGPNGAGKTTLIKTALGLIRPISGKVEFFNQPLEKARKRIAYVPQKETVDWDFPITVRDLVLMGRYGHLGLFRWPRQADYAAVHEYLEMVGMELFAHRQISQLSGGQQQRVFLARALIQEADIYLMDEPFVGIDLGTRQVIMDILHKLRDQGKTVCVVHHELDSVDNYFDWVIMLNIRLVASGRTEEVFTRENLNACYGKSYALFDEALKISKSKQQGL